MHSFQNASFFPALPQIISAVSIPNILYLKTPASLLNACAYHVNLTSLTLSPNCSILTVPLIVSFPVLSILISPSGRSYKPLLSTLLPFTPDARLHPFPPACILFSNSFLECPLLRMIDPRYLSHPLLLPLILTALSFHFFIFPLTSLSFTDVFCLVSVNLQSSSLRSKLP